MFADLTGKNEKIRFIHSYHQSQPELNFDISITDTKTGDMKKLMVEARGWKSAYKGKKSKHSATGWKKNENIFRGSSNPVLLCLKVIFINRIG